MAQARLAPTTPNTSAASVAGILAGLVTVALVAAFLSGRDGDSPAETATVVEVSPLDFEPGTCFNLGLGGSAEGIITLDCDSPHQAEMVGTVEYPDTAGGYPGANVLSKWSVGACGDNYTEYLGDDILRTSLDGQAIYPSAKNWSDGNHAVNCYLTTLDGSYLSSTLVGAVDDHIRGDRVIISRLLPGDCFRAETGSDPLNLDSRSAVNLVTCDEPHHGVFFGRDTLSYPPDTDFPDEALLTQATIAACANQFQSHFGFAVHGFNFRYWRPNAASWANNDRAILCTILDNVLLEEPFTPSAYRPLFDLVGGTCFNAGPGENTDTLGKDDKVKPIDCEELHIGQMVASGHLSDDDDEEFPGTVEIQEETKAVCSDALEEFLDRNPVEEDFEGLKYWQPDDQNWADGDRRYVCSFATEATMGSRQPTDT